MHIAVISPHRDDAAFSLTLTIGAWLEQGHSVIVVSCFTRSNYAPFCREQSGIPSERVEVVSASRAREDLAWMQSYDQKSLSMIDLALEDAPLRLHCTELEVCGFPVHGADHAPVAIQLAIRACKPDGIVSPFAVGGHVDHVTAREAALEESIRSGIPIAFYEDLPYAARPGAEAELSELVTVLAFDLEASFFQVPSAASVAPNRKLQVASIYSSQIDKKTAHDIADFSNRYKGRERVWLSRAWRENSSSYFEVTEASNAQ